MRGKAVGLFAVSLASLTIMGLSGVDRGAEVAALRDWHPGVWDERNREAVVEAEAPRVLPHAGVPRVMHGEVQRIVVPSWVYRSRSDRWKINVLSGSVLGGFKGALAAYLLFGNEVVQPIMVSMLILVGGFGGSLVGGALGWLAFACEESSCCFMSRNGNRLRSDHDDQ